MHTPHSFQETSTHQPTSHSTFAGSDKLVLKINVPKGTPVIPTTALTQSHSNEYGMIFSRHVQYSVNKLYQSNGKIYADVDLIHPGKKMSSMAAAKEMSQAEYIALTQAAHRLGFSSDQIDMALGTGGKNGEATPVSWKLLRARLAAEIKKGQAK
jgi:hypothetical protein